MSDSFETAHPSGSGDRSPDQSGKVDAAAHEAADLTATATTQAKDVLESAKAEASTVVGEAKTQAKDLYAQTQKELKDQAATQQQRLAVGLRAVGDELGSMASSSENGGVASDLVGEAARRLSSAGAWLSDRDPSSVLDEVRRYARRKPGTFILGGAIAGIVVGRLTRALASRAADEKQQAEDGPAPTAAPAPAPAPRLIEPDPWAATPVRTSTAAREGAPVYAQTASYRSDILQEDGDDRHHSV